MENNTVNKIKAFFASNYAWIAILVSVLLAIGTRIRGYQNIISGENIQITNSELFLNLRNIEYVSKNFPTVLRNDVYLNYPAGATGSTSLFDYIGGILTLIANSLNVPFESAKLVLLILPVVFFALSVIPIYFATKEIFNKRVGVITVLIYPIIPSQLYTESILGQGSGETLSLLLFSVSIFYTVKLIKLAEKDVISVELLEEKVSIETLKDSITPETPIQYFLYYTIVASLVITLLGFTSSNGVILYASIIIAFTVLYSFSRTFYDAFIEPVLLSLPVLTVLPLLVHTISGYITAFEQFLLISSSITTISLIGINKKLIDVEKTKRKNILNVACITIPVVISGAIFAVPQLNTLFTQVFTDTIVQNYTSIGVALWSQFGALLIPAIIGIVALTVTDILNNKLKSHTTFIYTTVIISSLYAYYTVMNIYLTVSLTVLAAFGIEFTLRKVNLYKTGIRRYKGYQIATAFMILLLFVPVLLYPVSGTVFTEISNNSNPIEYQDTGDWIQENTPQSGDYQTDLQAEYGLVNNHESGYQLSYESHRPVVGTDSEKYINGLSEYLTANPNETNPTEEFATAEGISEEEFNDKYVVLDWRSVTAEAELGEYVENSQDKVTDFYTPVFTQNEEYAFSLYTDAYYQSLAAKLYHYHGSAFEPQPVVVRTESLQQGTVTPGDIRRQNTIKTFKSMEKAEEFIDNNSGQIGGLYSNPTTEVSHVENYRLVYLDKNSVTQQQQFNRIAGRTAQFHENLEYSDIILEPSSIKTFEKVHGATIKGSNAYPNSTIEAQIELKLPEKEGNLYYTAKTKADSKGNYSMTVPYATTGFSEYTAEEGYTNTAIKPTGPYTIYNSVDSKQIPRTSKVSITEGQIYGEEDPTVNGNLSQRARISLGGGQ